MSQRAYKIIFVLLGCCVLFIVGLQAYWIRNFYFQEKEAFDRNVYAVLEQLSEKLQERKNLQTLKMTYIIQNGDTLIKTPSGNFALESEENIQVINTHNEVQATQVISLQKGKKVKDSIRIEGGKRSVNIHVNGKKAKVTVFNRDGKEQRLGEILENSNKVLEESKEISALVDKMMTEIKVLDAETENADTLHALIKRTLNNKGLFLPFEFSIQNLGNKKKVLVQSPGFSENVQTYKGDLSANKIIPTNEFLYLQFPSQSDFVMAGMKGSIILSLLFSLLIIGVFYYVIRLIHNQKKLSEIKTDFVNNMTHELKMPIATISLALDAIANPLVKNDEEKFAEYSRILKEENQKLNQHVERVLQLALLEKGELLPEKSSINASELITEVINSYKLQIIEQRAVVVFEPPVRPVILVADKQHFRTLLSNLLDNALKYSSEHCRIVIELAMAGDMLCISVRDNGIGIEADKQEKIFEKFYRVQGGNLHDVKGFGLGLSYVKSIVEAHGGTIEVKSEPGKGSEFVMYFKTL